MTCRHGLIDDWTVDLINGWEEGLLGWSSSDMVDCREGLVDDWNGLLWDWQSRCFIGDGGTMSIGKKKGWKPSS